MSSLNKDRLISSAKFNPITYSVNYGSNRKRNKVRVRANYHSFTPVGKDNRNWRKIFRAVKQENKNAPFFNM